MSVAAVTLVAGCQTDVQPSPEPTVVITAPSATPAPSPHASLPTESTTATLTFGESDFSGFTVGRPLGQFAQVYDANRDACGEQGPFRFAREPGPPDDNPWVLWVAIDLGEDAGEVDPDGRFTADEAPIAWFGLEATVAADLSAPLGPEGPHGLRLGSPEMELVDVHPDAAVQEYLAEYYNETYLLYTVQPDADSTMVYAVRDGVVVDIRWGSPGVAVDWEHQLCSEGAAPFDW